MSIQTTHPHLYRIHETRPEGLTESEVEERRLFHGSNSIPVKKKSRMKAFLAQFQDVMVYILLGAAAISLLVPLLQYGTFHVEELIDTIIILAIVFINAILGFLQEWRAENAIQLLSSLSAPKAKVRRDGVVSIISSIDLVPGDTILIEAGDRLSADAHLIAVSQLEVDESALTGESLPVLKQVEEHADHNKDSFSRGMVYTGTLVTRGYAEAIVTHTGVKTEMGKITIMVSEAEIPETPLSLELKRTGSKIGLIVLILCIGIFAIGILKGHPLKEMFFTVISLAVAAVPEGLPTIVTLCLAFGVKRMTEKHVLIRKLDSIETLGSVSVICADKTGTITQNIMTVQDVWCAHTSHETLINQAASSCNHAVLPDIGDPTEVALLRHGTNQQIARFDILEEEVPFSSEEKYMVTSHRIDGTSKKIRFMKGAPESVARFIEKNEAEMMLKKAEEYSLEGKRVLAFAMAEEGEKIYQLLGVMALIDPPREGVLHAIERAKHAGIRTVMITGDHPLTALSIAKQVGIQTASVIDGEALESMNDDDLFTALKTVSVFARVRPKHKVRILEAFQKQGCIVAMSGDGVNDAPALKRANVGVGMGKNGTDVARDAASIVLTDDNYATIVDAIAEGRRIYDNISKFVLFLMRSNIGEVCIIATAVLVGMPLPLLPIQILWINLVTDSFPALALSIEPAEAHIMKRPPRPMSKHLFSGEWSLLLLAGVLNAALVMIMFTIVERTYPGHIDTARTVAMMTTILFQMFLALSSRVRFGFFFQDFFKNPWLIVAILCSIGLQFFLLFTPLGALFSVTSVPLIFLEEMVGLTIIGFLIFEMTKVGIGKFRT